MKNLSSAFIAELAQPGVQPVFFAEIVFENETVYVWSGFDAFTPAGPMAVATFVAGEAATIYNCYLTAPPTPTPVAGQVATYAGGSIPGLDGAYTVSDVIGDEVQLIGPSAASTETATGGTLTINPAVNPQSTFPYGATFTGLGWLGKISVIPQTVKVQAQSVVLALSGIPASLVPETVNQVRLSGTVTIWFAFMNGEGALLSGIDPQQMFYGSTDVPSLTDDGDTCTLTISCENTLLSLNLAPNKRFNDADQQVYFPGDLGFSFVDSLANQNLFWPSPAPNSSTYPNFLQITPANPDVAVGGTVQVTVKMTYSDGSTYSHPGGGGGSDFTCLVASSNPKIATVDPFTGIVTGVSPGECSIYVRVTYYQGSGIPSVMYRAAGSIFVHS